MRRFCWYALVVALLLPMVAYGTVTPKEAVGFFGVVTGKVKSVQSNGQAFSLTVIKAVPAGGSLAKDPAAMVGKVIPLGTRMPRDKDGRPMPHKDDVAYIKTLKVGDIITVTVFAVHGAPEYLRIQEPGKPAATQPAVKPGD